jgi:hypothetical protein
MFLFLFFTLLLAFSPSLLSYFAESLKVSPGSPIPPPPSVLEKMGKLSSGGPSELGFMVDDSSLEEEQERELRIHEVERKRPQRNELGSWDGGD